MGGRAAVIVPDGVLFDSGKAHNQIRKTLVDKHKLQAVISMRFGVFKPCAGVSIAVLLFTKTNSAGMGKVWFYNMTADDYSLDEKGNKIVANDICDIIARFKNLEQESERFRTDRSFFVQCQIFMPTIMI